jgi:integrase
MGARLHMTGSPTMVTIKLRFVHQDVDRYGHVRIYFWRKGQRKVRIREHLGTPEFFEVYRRLIEQSESGALPPAAKESGRPAQGTWRWLCTQYFGSADFRRLQASSQSVQRRILEATFDEPAYPGAKEKFADFPLNRMQAKAVRVLRDLKATPNGANNRLKSVRRLFNWAVDHDYVTSSPARDVKYVTTGSQGFHTWTIDEVEQFEARHEIGSKARLALALLMYTGVRRSDVVLLGRQHVRSGWIKFVQQKNQRRKPVTIEVPMLPALLKVIDASPTGDLTFIVTSHGKPYSAAGFGNWFRDRCNEAGLSQCSAHGLRKAGATIAAENGATTKELMAIFGWLTMQEAERYSQSAERKKLAGRAMPLLQRIEKGT